MIKSLGMATTGKLNGGIKVWSRAAKSVREEVLTHGSNSERLGVILPHRRPLTVIDELIVILVVLVAKGGD